MKIMKNIQKTLYLLKLFMKKNYLKKLAILKEINLVTQQNSWKN